MRVWSSLLSCETPAASKNTTKIPRENPTERRKNQISGGRGKKARNIGPPPGVIDFGQFRLRPISTSANFDFGQFDFGQFLDVEFWDDKVWGPRRVGSPKFRVFSLLRHSFYSSFSLLGSFRGILLVFEGRNPEMCTFGVLGLSCASPGGPVWWGQKHHQNSTKGPQERERRKKIVAEEGKRSAKFWALHLSGFHLRGSTLRGLHPSGPTLGASTLSGPHTLWSKKSTSKNWPKSNSPKSKLAENEIGRSRNWPNSKLAEVELAELEKKNWPKFIFGRSRSRSFALPAVVQRGDQRLWPWLRVLQRRVVRSASSTLLFVNTEIVHG